MWNVSWFKTRGAGLYAVFFILMSACGHASASVVIDGTRVIYLAEQPEVSVRLTNQGTEPKLVQVWIDDGDRQASPDKIKVPFIVLTPIFRMDANKGQVTRIQYLNNMPLPADKESVFWLNVLEIPAKPTGEEAEENYLQFRYRTRIKLFYRPKGLAGTAVEAPDRLKFRYKPGYVQVENPTAYHVSMVELEVGKDAVGGKIEPHMLAPFSTTLLKLNNATKQLSAPTINYKAINDYGGAPDREKSADPF
jgi:P pilus assembly chaperone PapD